MHTLSDVMIDKTTTIPREKAESVFGRLEESHMVSIERLSALYLGFGTQIK